MRYDSDFGVYIYWIRSLYIYSTTTGCILHMYSTTTGRVFLISPSGLEKEDACLLLLLFTVVGLGVAVCQQGICIYAGGELGESVIRLLAAHCEV